MSPLRSVASPSSARISAVRMLDKFDEGVDPFWKQGADKFNAGIEGFNVRACQELMHVIRCSPHFLMI